MPAQEREIELYRNLMPVPDHFEEGFGGKTVIGALFLGFIMVPASMYLTLFMGAGLGPAAQWVTVILFSEMVKRSMKSLREQEIYVLFYMTGIVLSGGVGQQLLWNQYLVQSPAAVSMGVAPDIPWWIAPSRDVLSHYGRTFFTPYWLKPILFMAGSLLLGRIDNFGLGYAIYRITAHVEKLPFPMAPVGALGVTALVDDRNNPQRWKQRCFMLGGVLGLAWGIIYIGVPAVTGAIFNGQVQIIPIPWLDLTPALSKETFLPATPLNIVFDLSLVLTGMALPFWAVMGSFLGFLSTLVLNPMLYHNGFLPSWRAGDDVINTIFKNQLDFYLSFAIGLMLAIFLVSVAPLLKPLMTIVKGFVPTARDDGNRLTWARFKEIMFERNRDRGDLSIITALSLYVATTLTYILVCLWLMPGTPEHGYHDRFPWLFFLGFGFLYQPTLAYINAKLAGMVGQSLTIPMVREASYILSGYHGAAIWFAPIPQNDYGGTASGFRTMELTGTKLTSIIKTEFLVYPVLIVSTVVFAQLIWRMGEIPGPSFPFTREVWHQTALNTSLQVTSTLDGSSQFLEAIKPKIIAWGAVAGLGSFMFLSFLNLPQMLIYGMVAGLGTTTPGGVIPMMIGALLSRFYFEKKFGAETFKKYSMILLAGFAAGVGLVGMIAVAVNLIVKSTTTLGY